MRGNHGALDRHAVIFDLVSITSRTNKNRMNVKVPTQTDPIWTCHLRRLFIFCPHNSIRSGNVVSMVMNAQPPPNDAISSVVGV
jgi:hypothetical protein